MRILLTGATGYLGSHLAQRLVRRNHELGCIVRNHKRLGRLESIKDAVNLIHIDKLEKEILNFHPEIVIHTACTYSRKGNSESEIISGNLIFPLRVMWIVKRLGILRWINTDTFLPPMINSYALSKKQFVQWGTFYAEMGEIEFINLVLEHFYGPDAPEENFLSWVIQQLKSNTSLALTSGVQKRDFIYIEDVLNVYEAVLCHLFEKNYTEIKVGTGDAPTIREVVEYLKEITYATSALRFGAVPTRENEPSSHCDTTSMKLLGIDKTMAWRDGMKLLL